MEKNRNAPVILPTTIRYVFFLALLVVIAISARYFAFSIFEATKDEASLGILHGDVLLAVRESEPHRGQLVFDANGVLARVLAIEGDRLEVRGNRLWVNEEAAWYVKESGALPPQILDQSSIVLGLGDQVFSWPKQKVQSRAIVVLISLSPLSRKMRWERVLHTLN